MSSVNELAEGLARRCDGIPGLRCYPEMAAKPEPPALCVGGPIRWTYDDAMAPDGERPWTMVFELWVFVAAADLRSSQQALFSYLAPSGPRSIPAALYGDHTLGGVAEEVKVLGGVRSPAVTDTAGGQLLGCALEVEVTAV